MMSADELRYEDLQISVRGKGGVVVVEWKGASDAPDPAAVLQPFLVKLAEQSVGRAVVVDLRPLQFMNSATVAPVLAFVRHLDRLHISTRLVYDGQAQWQRVQCNCMKAIARTMSHIEVDLS